LIKQLSKWRSEGDKLIVCLDTNEHIYRKGIGKSLTDIEGLAMKEVVGEFTGKAIGTMFFGGQSLLMGCGQHPTSPYAMQQ